jgi:ssDNA-specific exonuclease RecJ
MSRAREVSKIVLTVDLVENSINNIDLSSTIITASAAAVSALVNNAPEALDTLIELSNALNDDPNFYNTVANIYLSQSSASNIYLNQTSASTIYLTQNNAQSSYVAKDLNQIIFKFFTTPLIQQWSWTGNQNLSQTLSTSIPTTAKYLLADVFLTASSSDHQNIVLSDTATQNRKNWVDVRNTQPSTTFGDLSAERSVILTYYGEADNFTSNYGLWYSSQIVPTSGRTLYWGNFGNSGSNGWIYIRIRGYSE